MNGEINIAQVRLIGAEGENLGIVSIEDARRATEAAGLDLVEIVPTAEPPVCRIMDFGKYNFDLQKKANAAKKKQKIVEIKERHAAKRKQKQIQVKEIKFRPGTDEGDYLIKLRNLKRFLEQGDKVKVTLRFRGREMAHQELGAQMLRRVESDLEQLGLVEQFPKLEGRQMVMVIAPKRI